MYAAAAKFFLPALTLSAGFLLAPRAAFAQSVATLTTRMQQTAAESSLDTAGTTPWHLKLEIQLFGPKALPAEQGSIEEWWADQDNWRITYISPSVTGTELHVGDKLYQTTTTGSHPVLFDDILDQVVHPLIHEGDMSGGKPDLRKQSFGKTQLDCIMLDQPLANVAFPPLGLFPTFCLDPGKATLRIALDNGSLLFIRPRIGTFLGRSVPIDLAAQAGEEILAKAHISTLSTMKVDAMALTPTADMPQAASNGTRIAGNVIAGNIITKVPPIYPERAKQNHSSGKVLLHAIIGRDGRVRSLRVISTPDGDLAIASLQAVRQWVYRPYLLNGLPTEVDTTITVNFSFAPA